MAAKNIKMKRSSKTPIMKSGLVEEPINRPSVRYKARGKYRVVDGASKMMIEPSSPEVRTEDEILSPTKRAMLLDLTRNLVRNSSLFNTILGQLQTNVVSTCGGKVVLSLPNEETNKDLRKTFFSYTRNVDFYTGDNLNRLLKRVLREYVIGGDCILLFDDGLIENSGKVLLFESNEIVDVPLSAVQEHYGKGAWISQGKVYSPNGRHIGTVVSKSQKNLPCSVVDPSKCYFLKKDHVTEFDINLNVQYVFTFGEFGVYPFAGVSLQSASPDYGDSESKFGANVGAGAEYSITEKIKLNLEFTYKTGSNEFWDRSLIGVGASYKF